jgi:protein-L-isoaspartate(D-aspartate) O-methyltransferase
MDFEIARARLIESLAQEITDKRVLAVMAQVPRHIFVPPELQAYAYEDRPLPIGNDQTISQPFIVALMTQSLDLTGTEKVLELGTGSGYQTAILSQLARHVVSTERIPALADKARKTLEIIGYRNIEVHVAEEALGWKSSAPYDAIIATAGAPNVPTELIAQLAIGGRMVIPVGSRYNQELLKLTRLKTGNKVEQLGACRFVSLIGKGAWEQDNSSF